VIDWECTYQVGKRVIIPAEYANKIFMIIYKLLKFKAMENESNKMTAVEWVLQYLNNVKPNEFCSIEKIKELLEQAKKMEKEQIEDAYADGVDDEYEYHINDEPRKNTKEYYLKKYGKTFIDLVSDEESKVHEVVRKLKEKKN
jgi:hypothetical protein